MGCTAQGAFVAGGGRLSRAEWARGPGRPNGGVIPAYAGMTALGASMRKPPP